MNRQNLPEPDWDVIWEDDSSKPLIIFKAYFRLRLRSYQKLLSGVNLRGKEVLELGGGTGYLGHLLSKNFYCNVSVIDNSIKAREFHNKFGISNSVRYIVGDFFRHNGSYDIVFSDGLIEHYEGKRLLNVLKLHKKFLKDNGLIAIFAPNKSFISRRLLSLKNALERKYTAHELRREVESAGFKILRTAEDFHMIGLLCAPN